VAKAKTHPERFKTFSCRFLFIFIPSHLWKVGLTLLIVLTTLPLPAREKDAIHYGTGILVNVPFPESEVVQAVQEVVQNGIIRGSKEYNKDEYITGAEAVSSINVFPRWKEGGQVFYKVRLKALDPRNFKDSGDMGTLAVRYVVKRQDDSNTVLRIDAVFVEDFRKVSHASNGSVESAEYKDIHDHLEYTASMKAETIEAEKEKQEYRTKKEQATAMAKPGSSTSAAKPAPTGESSSVPPQPAATTTATNESTFAAPQRPQENVIAAAAPQSESMQSSSQSLEQHVQDLRRQVERIVKSPGAPLKSAPFNTASTLQSLPAGTEVLIVISTTYWLGIETHDGQHGWMLRDQLELLP
jgi:hypothetical protein